MSAEMREKQFIIRLPAISPTSVIPHDLGGFSLRSKTL